MTSDRQELLGNSSSNLAGKELRHWAILQIKISSLAMAERPRELDDFKKARVNGGTDNHSLKGCLLYTSDAADE